MEKRARRGRPATIGAPREGLDPGKVGARRSEARRLHRRGFLGLAVGAVAALLGRRPPLEAGGFVSSSAVAPLRGPESIVPIPNYVTVTGIDETGRTIFETIELGPEPVLLEYIAPTEPWTIRLELDPEVIRGRI